MQGFCALFVGHQQLIKWRIDVAREGWFLPRHEVVDECGQGLVAQSRFDAAIFFPDGSGDDNFGGHDSWMVLEMVVRAHRASGGVDFGVSDRASVGGLFCFGKGRVRLSKMQIFKQLFSRFFCGL